MLRQIEDQYRREDSDLAPYAIHNLASKGRKFPEPQHPFRTNFQRDRDRILHSRFFRRLEYKTQVFLNGTGDHLRTRLTHTMEVAAISRTIARALYLNEDLAETIALAHDIGHPPFGHSAERALNELLGDFGGFDHNDQALKIIDVLEKKYPDFDGLNMTWEVRTGLIKHRGYHKKAMLDGEELPPLPFLESQLADIADDLTYYGHDLDDGLDSGLIDEKMIEKIEIVRIVMEKVAKAGLKKGNEKFRPYLVRCLIDMMVENVILTTNNNIENNSIMTPDDAQRRPERTVSFSREFEEMTLNLKDFLFKNVYFHPSVTSANDNAVDRLKTLFFTYIKSPDLLGKTTKTRIKGDGLHRTVADYIAGMTDRYALLEYKRCCK